MTDDIDMLTAVAEKGDAAAQMKLGKYYYEQCDAGMLEKAICWYRCAAEAGHVEAQKGLADCLYSNKNYDEAKYWYCLAAEQGCEDAVFLLGVYYHCGEGVERDYMSAPPHKSSKAKKEAKPVKIKMRFDREVILLQNYRRKLEWCKYAAARGDAIAMHTIGVYYHKGMGVEADDAIAAKWFHDAAQHGCIGSQLMLGDWYRNGTGVEQDYEQATYWYTKAKLQGSVNAARRLKKMKTQESNAKHAIVKMKQIIQDGQAATCIDRDLFNFSGGILNVYTELVEGYLMMAKMGNVRAQKKIGDSYLFGLGIEQNIEQALYWYHLAAEQGHSHAQYRLGTIYEDGLYAVQDKEKALCWYRLAAEQGFLQANDKMNALMSAVKNRK